MVTASTILFLNNLIFGFIQFILSLRVLLRLLGAQPAPFVQWVMETSAPLLSPFEGMFPTARLEGGFVVEISALFALLIYGLLGYVIAEIIAHAEYHALVYRENHSRSKRG